DGALLHVPRRQELHELESIRAVDLDLPLHPDVPQGDVVDEMPVLIDRVRVESGHEHVVVEVVRPDAVLGGPMEVRRFLDPSRLPESRENRTRVVVRRLRQHTVARTVKVPTSFPSFRTGHGCGSQGRTTSSPGTSTPTSFLEGPSFLIFFNAFFPMKSCFLSRSTSHPKPASYGL